ncbi:MAG: ATP-binding protein, partial [Spirochaetales bacterium]|nr:ATP-binding protein [Spirochaetales bacterium]
PSSAPAALDAAPKLAHPLDLIRQVDRRTDYVSSVFASMQDAVLFMDCSCRILLYNERATQLLGVGPACLFDRTGSEEAGPFAEILKVCGKVLAMRTTERFDLQDGKGRSLSVSLTPVYSKYQGHELLGVLALAEDVTELRKAERLKKEFVANVSHEFRTPLTLIRGVTEMLEFWDDLAPINRERALALLSVETERLSRLIAEVLMLSEMEHKVQAEFHEHFEAVAVAKEAAESLLPLAERKHLQLTVAAGPACELEGMSRWFFHAVRNLVENAIKYTSEGGWVAVRSRVEGEESGLSSGGRQLVIEVADNGIGIDPSEHARIFERFYRVDKSHSSKTGGSGLGLPIANDIVKLHGGHIEVASAPGQGSTFRIVVPLPSATEAANSLDTHNVPAL